MSGSHNNGRKSEPQPGPSSRCPRRRPQSPSGESVIIDFVEGPCASAAAPPIPTPNLTGRTELPWKKRSELLKEAKENIERMEVEAEKLKSENNFLRQRVVEVESAFEEKARQVEELEKDLGARKLETLKLVKEMEDEKEKRSEMAKNLEERNAQLELSREENQRLSSVQIQASEELTVLRNELDRKILELENVEEMRNTLKALENDRKDLQEDLVKKEALLKNLESAVDVEPYQKEIERLEAKVKEQDQVIKNCVELSQENTNQMLLISTGTDVGLAPSSSPTAQEEIIDTQPMTSPTLINASSEDTNPALLPTNNGSVKNDARRSQRVLKRPTPCAKSPSSVADKLSSRTNSNCTNVTGEWPATSSSHGRITSSAASSSSTGEKAQSPSSMSAASRNRNSKLEKRLNAQARSTPIPHSEGKVTCPSCSKKFSSRWRLNSHKIRKHTEHKRVCDVCNLSFGYLYELNNHLKTKSCQERRGRMSEAALCETCGLPYLDKKEHEATCAEFMRSGVGGDEEENVEIEVDSPPPEIDLMVPPPPCSGVTEPTN